MSIAPWLVLASFATPLDHQSMGRTPFGCRQAAPGCRVDDALCIVCAPGFLLGAAAVFDEFAWDEREPRPAG